MRLRRMLVSIGILLLVGGASTVPLRGQGARFGKSSFELGVGQSFDAEGRTSLAVSASVPYRSLVFFKRADHYEARYRLYVDIRRSGKETVRGDVWEESVLVQDYEQTKSASAVSTSRRDFPIDAGEYDVSVTVEVIDTSLRYTRERRIKILGFEGEGFRLSAPAFFTPLGASSGSPKTARAAKRPPAGEIVMTFCAGSEDEDFKVNSDAVYADFVSWPRAMVHVVTPADSSIGGEWVLSSRVRDVGGNVMLYARTRSAGAGARIHRLCMDINADGLAIGDYELSIAVDGPEAERRAVSSGRFTVLLNRSSLGRHFGETIELLSLVADEEELKELAQAEPEKRIEAWNRFWMNREAKSSSRTDGSLGLGDFLGRLEHVMRFFSSFRAGWRTDRGKIYLRYGEPDDIAERQGRTFGTNYQLWYYYSRGLLYIFEDMMGTGDYRLIETQML